MSFLLAYVGIEFSKEIMNLLLYRACLARMTFQILTPDLLQNRRENQTIWAAIEIIHKVSFFLLFFIKSCSRFVVESFQQFLKMKVNLIVH